MVKQMWKIVNFRKNPSKQTVLKALYVQYSSCLKGHLANKRKELHLAHLSAHRAIQ